MAAVKEQKHGRDRGTAIIETALVLPILLMLTLGVIHYGWLFLKYHQITNAARSGARFAICDKTGNVTSYVETILSNNGIKNANVTSIPENYASKDVAAGTEIKVTISVDATPANGVALFSGFNGPLIILPTPASLSASVTMAKEGPDS